MHCASGWMLLQCLNKYKNDEELWVCETFILIKTPNVALVGGWKTDDDGLMVQLDSPCCIFDENESEEFQCFLEMVDAFAKPESDKSLPNADEYNQFEVYLKKIKILNEEVVYHNEFHKMCMNKLHQRHNDHQTLKKEMVEMRVREADLVKRNGGLEITTNILEKTFATFMKKSMPCMNT